MTILSYGGGVNSTALLVRWLDEGNKLDAIIFADPGSEMPETYDLIEQHTIPFCKEQNIPFVTVRYTNRKGEQPSIYAEYDRVQRLPARTQRSCTGKFKIDPITKYLKQNYPDALQLIGIDYSEKHRAKVFIDPETGKEEYVYPNVSYPLIDWKMDREDCATYLTERDWPLPVKSGCFFCPFAKKSHWADLFETHPALYEKATNLESQNKKFPEWTLMYSKPGRLDWFQKAMETQTTLDSYIDDEEPNIPCMCYDG